MKHTKKPVTKKADIMEQINKSFLKFLEPLTPQETYKRIVHEAINLIEGVDGRVAMKTPMGLQVVYSSSSEINRLPIRKNGHTYFAYKNRKALVVQAEEFKHIYPGENFQSVIFIPLFYKNQSMGVLLVRSRTAVDFSSEELKILKLFGSMASLTLRKVQLLFEAEKNLEIKDKFLALAAHELRTPLTTMSGYIQLLNRKVSKKQSVESKWINLLHTESSRLTNLIEEILEINKMNAGSMKYSYSENNLDTILKNAISKIHSMYEDVNFDYQKQADPLIIGDAAKVSQAFFNILENAVKFSHSNTKITIKVSKKQQNTIVEISDSGTGIPNEDLPFVFEGFYKSAGNEKDGMGLGLFYTKNVLTAHKGEIEIQSQLNIGTKVVVKLPIVKYGTTSGA